jgi:hypothetical protein
MSPNFVPIVVLLSICLTIFTWWLVYVYVDQPCSDATLAQYHRLHRHCTALSHQNKYHSESATDIKSHFWGPTWSCPLADEIGHSLDVSSAGGTKWICDVDHIDTDCIVYSFGQTANYTFELEMNLKYDCDVHIFDVAKSSENFKGLTHHRWNERSTDKLSKLAGIVDALGHNNRDIDVLSLNVHGCELDILANPNLWQELASRKTRIDQIIVTITAPTESDSSNPYCSNAPAYSPQSVHKLFSLFSRNGYAVFHREHKHGKLHGKVDKLHYDSANIASEFSFVRINYDCDTKMTTDVSKYLSF